nr:Cbb3-type cytochrome oxidase component FixQ [uncultured bacterium]
MGIRFNCPNGHKLNVKEFLAGKRGVCPQCGAKFVIPMQAEAPQPIGVGQSQSIEIAVSPGPSHQVASAAASPSIIIPVTEIELAPPEEVLQPAAVLPASIVVGPPLIVAGPVGVAPDAVVPSRERSRRNQMVISLLLLGLVILLAGILIWVLRREVNRTPVEKTSAVDHGEFHQVFAMASGGFPMSPHPSVGALEQ